MEIHRLNVLLEKLNRTSMKEGTFPAKSTNKAPNDPFK